MVSRILEKALSTVEVSDPLEDDFANDNFTPLPPPPTEDLNFGTSGNAPSSSVKSSSAPPVDVFGVGDLLFASPPLAPSTNSNSSPEIIPPISAKGDDILDIFSPSKSDLPVTRTSASLTADDILGTILASGGGVGRSQNNEITSSVADVPGVEVKVDEGPSEADLFLEQIPDISFILEDTITLPGLEKAPVRGSVSSAWDDLGF